MTEKPTSSPGGNAGGAAGCSPEPGGERAAPPPPETIAAPSGESGAEKLPVIDGTGWPEPITREAFIGPVGRYVELLAPFTEADRAAVLVHLLVALGNVVGRWVFVQLGCQHVYANLFAAVAGGTGLGRKNAAWSEAKLVLAAVAPEWLRNCVLASVASGEGLIEAVRDERHERRPVRQNGKVVGYEDVLVDEGVADKRLLIASTEFSTLLKIMRKPGNTLSGTLRCAFDGDPLAIRTRRRPSMATEPHISLVGHISPRELRQNITALDLEGGLYNRIVWCCSRRAGMVVTRTGLPNADMVNLMQIIKFRLQAVAVGQPERLVLSPAAASLWAELYPQLSRPRGGVLEPLTARAPTLVMKLASVYAVFETYALTIEPEHLLAAKAVVDYSERSAAYLFRPSRIDRIADRVLKVLAERHPNPVAQTAIIDAFSRHVQADELRAVLASLELEGKIRSMRIPTAGRPATMWRLA
jgi:hypothetical protein